VPAIATKTDSGGFLRVGGLEDVHPVRPTRFHSEEIDLVVCRVKDEIFAVENRCPHQQFSALHEGALEGCTLTCPMHGWSFDLKTGRSTNGNGMLKTLAVKVEEGIVWVEKLGTGFPAA
jgi:nitrite reductase/ring-hydroxylating ferredoxin subunit